MLPRCSIFFSEENLCFACVCVCIVLPLCCKDVLFANIFLQFLIRRLHILPSNCVSMYGVCAYALCVKFSCGQNVPSFGSFSSICSIFQEGKLCLDVCLCTCALCVQVLCCQDILSFGYFLSRGSIFWRGKLFLDDVCVQPLCCEDVPFFGRFSSRCSIFQQKNQLSLLFTCTHSINL